jgi:hypothetical protein
VVCPNHVLYFLSWYNDGCVVAQIYSQEAVGNNIFVLFFRGLPGIARRRVWCTVVHYVTCVGVIGLSHHERSVCYGELAGGVARVRSGEQFVGRRASSGGDLGGGYSY